MIRRSPGTSRPVGAAGNVLLIAAVACGVLALLAMACAPVVRPLVDRALQPLHPLHQQAAPPLPQTLAAPGPTLPPAGGREVILSTTTSTQDSGLLDVLIPAFERSSGYRVKTMSVGSGAALALAAHGEVDVVLSHAPEAERAWMAEGHGASRRLVMHNDFVLVGPAADPAGIAGEASVAQALRRIVARGAVWVSRDDNSGTHQLEQRLWREAGQPPSGRWVVRSGAGMSATLTLADQEGAYTLADRATYLARKDTLGLKPLVEGDPLLLNPYHVMPLEAARFPGGRINGTGGAAFARWLLEPEAQRLIGAFERDRYGQPLFFPDAGKTEADLAR